MPAVPIAIGVGSMIANHYASKAAAKQAMEKTPQETAAFDANTKLATQQAQQGNEMFQTAMPGVKNSLNYYNTLLSGNRAARTAAVAPEAESVASAYDGANKAIGRGYVQGGQRDQAVAENARSKAGQIARLTTGVRPMAANAIAGISGSILPGAAQRAGTASNIYGQQANSEMLNRQYGNKVGDQTSQNFGRLFAQIMNLTKGGGGASGGLYPTGGGSGQPGDDAGWG